MTPTEFRTWMDRTRDLLPDVENFLAKAHDRQETTDTWFDIVKGTSLADANDVVDAMLRGDIEEPRSMSRLPRIVRQESYKRHAKPVNTSEDVSCRCSDCGRSFRPERVCHWCKSPNWNYEFGCGPCRDRGQVLVWGPRAMRAMQAAIESGESFKGYPHGQWVGMVQCTCGTGRTFSHLKHQWNPASMVAVMWPKEANAVDRLRAHVETAIGVGAARTAGFDAFNQGDA